MCNERFRIWRTIRRATQPFGPAGDKVDGRLYSRVTDSVVVVVSLEEGVRAPVKEFLMESLSFNEFEMKAE